MFQNRRRFPLIALPLLGTALLSHAQSESAPTPPDAAQSAPAPDATPDATATTQNAPAAIGQSAPQTPGERAQILRDAQARVQARRRLREQAIEQDTYTHKYEVYAGGGYLRFRPGHNLQHNTEAAWNVGITEWIRPKLGITADARGYYGTAITNNFEFQVFKPSISQYTFLAGPQYRFYQSQHWSWNAQALAGITHGNFSTGLGAIHGAETVGLYPDGNKLAVSVGAAADYNLSPALALRLMPDYLLTNYGSDIQHNLGFTIGAVYRWGRQ